MKLKALLVLCMVISAVMIFAKPTVIRLLEQDFLPSNPDDEQYVKLIETEFLKATGIEIDIQLVPIPSGKYADKVNVLLASGDFPDIIWFRDNVDIPYADQGLLMDLRAQVSKSETLKKAMPSWDMARLNSYPYLLWITPINPKIAVVREDWMKELGISSPRTVEDYYEMMKKLKTKAPNAITITGNLERLDSIFNAAFGTDQTFIKLKDGTYTYSRITQGEKEKLAFYNKLFKEGLLDPEFITVNWQSMEDKLYASKVAMVVGGSGTVVDMYQQRMYDSGNNTKLIALDPPIGISGKAGFPAVNVNRQSRGFAITTVSKVKDVAFKLLEFMATERGQFIDRLGVEGREYKVVNGKIEKTEKGLVWYPRFYENPNWNSPIELYGEVGKKSLEIVNKYYVEDNYFDMPAKYSTSWDEMNNLYKEYSIKIVTGEYPIEKFDEFVSKWRKAGGDTYIKLANEFFKKSGK